MKAIIIVGMAVMLSSCANNIVYHSFQSLKNDKWNEGQNVAFVLPELDSLKTYRISLEVRYKNIYKYKNIATKLYLTYDSTMVDSLRHNIMLVNGRENWVGQGIGDSYVISKKVNNFKPKRKGVYKINVIPNMKQKCIENISDVGILVENVTEKE